MTICEECGVETMRSVTKFYATGPKTTCFRCEHPVHSSPAANPYADLTLEHVITEDGKPLHVTSKRQLLEAEKKYHFRSLVAHTDEANFDKPPQTEKRNLNQMFTDTNRWMYPETAKRMLKDFERGEIT